MCVRVHARGGRGQGAEHPCRFGFCLGICVSGLLLGSAQAHIQALTQALSETRELQQQLLSALADVKKVVAALPVPVGGANGTDGAPSVTEAGFTAPPPASAAAPPASGWPGPGAASAPATALAPVQFHSVPPAPAAGPAAPPALAPPPFSYLHSPWAAAVSTNGLAHGAGPGPRPAASASSMGSAAPWGGGSVAFSGARGGGHGGALARSPAADVPYGRQFPGSPPPGSSASPPLSVDEVVASAHDAVVRYRAFRMSSPATRPQEPAHAGPAVAAPAHADTAPPPSPQLQQLPTSTSTATTAVHAPQPHVGAGAGGAGAAEREGARAPALRTISRLEAVVESLKHLQGRR
jgi:hypothetical protein